MQPTITMQPVDSSQIESIGHDPATGTLAVKFKSGGLYHYHDVPASKYADLLKAESVGKFLHAHVKPAHPFTKQGEK